MDATNKKYSKYAIISISTVGVFLFSMLINYSLLFVENRLLHGILFWIFSILTIFAPIAGLICGVIALVKIYRDNSLKGKFIAIAGIIFSILFLTYSSSFLMMLLSIVLYAL